ncbi:MAG: flagellar biosynthesis protein FlhB [Chloroflexota bacterium]
MADKTEAPSSRRLEEAREEGRVVRSQELNTAVILIAGAYLLRGPGAQLGSALGQMVTVSITELPREEITSVWFQKLAFDFLVKVMPSLGMIMVGILLTGVAVTLAQTQFLWAGKKIGFDFKRINPLEGFKRIFSSHGLIELLRSLIKLVWVSWFAYSFFKTNYPELIALADYDLGTAVSRFFTLCVDLTMRVGSMYLVLAAADYAYQRWDLYKSLRMSKEEVKEEYKRSEGDPMFKNRVRSMQRQMARGRMMSNVPNASVVVTNPTHLAIAIQYSEGMTAPKVLAKGPYRVAERIVKLAKENHIPVVQNIPLARAIYKTIDIGQEISPDLYVAMAEVLAYVFKLRGKMGTPPQASVPAPSLGSH